MKHMLFKKYILSHVVTSQPLAPDVSVPISAFGAMII